MLRRPLAPLDPLRSRIGTALRPLCARRAGGRALAGAWLFDGVPPRSSRGDVRASQVPGGPSSEHARLFDPGEGRSARPVRRPPVAFRLQSTASALAMVYFRGSITQPARSLCTLRSQDHSWSTQHAVPTGGQPWSGGIGVPAGSLRKVSEASSYILIPLSQASPGASSAQHRFAATSRATVATTAGAGCALGSRKPPTGSVSLRGKGRLKPLSAASSETRLILDYAGRATDALRLQCNASRQARRVSGGGALTDAEQDLLRAMLVFAAAGLDSLLKLSRRARSR